MDWMAVIKAKAMVVVAMVAVAVADDGEIR